MYGAPLPPDIEGADFWALWTDTQWGSFPVDPEEGDDAEVLLMTFDRWIRYGVEVLGYTRDQMIRTILQWAGIDELAHSGTGVIPSIPGFGYGPIDDNITYPGPRYYRFSEIEDMNQAISTLWYQYATCPEIFCSGEESNSISGESIVSLLQEAGYLVTENTTVAELRAMVPDLEAWLAIAAMLISANGQYSDYYDNHNVFMTDARYEELSNGDVIPALDAVGTNMDNYGFVEEACLFLPASTDEQGNVATFLIAEINPVAHDSRPCVGTLKTYMLDRGEPYVSETTTPAGEGNTLIKIVATIPTIFQNVSVSGLTPEQIVSTWPKFAKYFEDDTPVGLSATKKHFIRVI